MSLSVVVYDCRETRFRFDEDALSDLHSLPVFKGDLPENAIVSVAYTANTFPYALHMGAPKTETAVYFNVLFVIFLGEPRCQPLAQMEVYSTVVAVQAVRSRGAAVAIACCHNWL